MELYVIANVMLESCNKYTHLSNLFFCKQWMDETLYCMIIIVSNTVCLRSVKFDFLTPSIVILYNFLLPNHTITECIDIKSVLSMFIEYLSDIIYQYFIYLNTRQVLILHHSYFFRYIHCFT